MGKEPAVCIFLAAVTLLFFHTSHIVFQLGVLVTMLWCMIASRHTRWNDRGSVSFYERWTLRFFTAFHFVVSVVTNQKGTRHIATAVPYGTLAVGVAALLTSAFVARDIISARLQE